MLGLACHFLKLCYLNTSTGTTSHTLPSTLGLAIQTLTAALRASACSPVPQSLPSGCLWAIACKLGWVKPCREIPRAHHSPLWRWLSLPWVCPLLPHLSHKPTSSRKTKLIHVNNLEALKLFAVPSRLKVRIEAEGRRGGSASRNQGWSLFPGMGNGKWKEIVNLQEGKNSFYFPFSNSSPYCMWY